MKNKDIEKAIVLLKNFIECIVIQQLISIQQIVSGTLFLMLVMILH